VAAQQLHRLCVTKPLGQRGRALHIGKQDRSESRLDVRFGRPGLRDSAEERIDLPAINLNDAARDDAVSG